MPDIILGDQTVQPTTIATAQCHRNENPKTPAFHEQIQVAARRVPALINPPLFSPDGHPLNVRADLAHLQQIGPQAGVDPAGLADASVTILLTTRTKDQAKVPRTACTPIRPAPDLANRQSPEGSGPQCAVPAPNAARRCNRQGRGIQRPTQSRLLQVPSDGRHGHPRPADAHAPAAPRHRARSIRTARSWWRWRPEQVRQERRSLTGACRFWVEAFHILPRREAAVRTERTLRLISSTTTF